jgi:hypothetical protein
VEVARLPQLGRGQDRSQGHGGSHGVAVDALGSDQYMEQITGDTMDSMHMETGNLLTGTDTENVMYGRHKV